MDDDVANRQPTSFGPVKDASHEREDIVEREGGELRSSAQAWSWACSMCARVELREWRRRNEAHRVSSFLGGVGSVLNTGRRLSVWSGHEIWSGECFHGLSRCEASY